MLGLFWQMEVLKTYISSLLALNTFSPGLKVEKILRSCFQPRSGISLSFRVMSFEDPLIRIIIFSFSSIIEIVHVT